jgi:hypothetical protein
MEIPDDGAPAHGQITAENSTAFRSSGIPSYDAI